MNHLRPQFWRGIGRWFLFAIIAAIGLTCSSMIQPVLHTLQQGRSFQQGYHEELFITALSSDTLSAFLPVLAAIPLSSGYLDDIKSKYARFFVIRGGYTRYLTSIFLACFFVGGAVILIGSLCAYGLTALVFLPLEQIVENPPDLAAQIGQKFFLLFINGGIYAVLGMTMSTIMESKYIAYASPFIVYYLLVILYERYFPDAWLLYPKNWLDPEIWPYGVGSAALFLLELTFLCGLVFYIRGKRRLEQL